VSELLAKSDVKPNQSITMPETQTVELRTASVEQLIGLLRTQNLGINNLPVDRRETIATRLEEQIGNSPNAIALCGLPGAGKSFVSDKLSQVYDAPVISMGDAIRQEHKEQFIEGGPIDFDQLSSSVLGEFAADWRDRAPEEIPKKTASIAESKNSDLVIIDGVRSTTDVGVLKSRFDNFHLIEVTTPFYERLDRLTERGREGEESFDASDLAKRDLRELDELGFRETANQGHIDLIINNGKKDQRLPITLSAIVENNLPYEVEDGQPLGLDNKLEKIRQQVRK
jgi:dephospho-CoA kinase